MIGHKHRSIFLGSRATVNSPLLRMFFSNSWFVFLQIWPVWMATTLCHAKNSARHNYSGCKVVVCFVTKIICQSFNRILLYFLYHNLPKLQRLFCSPNFRRGCTCGVGEFGHHPNSKQTLNVAFRNEINRPKLYTYTLVPPYAEIL
jgi:hypothetical protein